MKKFAIVPALLLAAAGYVYLQTNAPATPLAALMPSGAMLYLESPDFGRLLRDWDGSKVQSDWLASENFAVFSRSNLFAKLNEVYGQYGAAAGFAPDLKSITEIAGKDSALALYDIRDVEFLYVGRIPEADLVSSPLWAVRAKFEQRQAGGTTFYLHTDEASKRTVAFAAVKGYLLLATRDDLVAQSLELLAGGGNPSIASDRWYREAVAQAQKSGDLRMVLNLDSLVKSVYFRSYWVQRNASQVRQYWTGVADVTRTSGAITETRAFLRTPGSGEPAPLSGSASISGLLGLVPEDAGMYKAATIADTSTAASLIVNKLIGSPAGRSPDWRSAPYGISPDLRAGGEGDLETRIDEQPLPADAGIADSVAAVRTLLDRSHAQASLLIQSSSPAAGTFVQMPSVIVLTGPSDWDVDLIRSSLATAAGKLWTTSQLGARWIPAPGQQGVERLDGLGAVLFATRGPLAFLGNDAAMLAAVVGRTAGSVNARPLSYAAGVRHLRERANYERVMTALDFTSNRVQQAGPAFFSGNIASLSGVFSKLAEIRVTEEETGAATIQTVLYQTGQ